MNYFRLTTVFLLLMTSVSFAQNQSTIEVQGYNHVGLYVKDLRESAKFYREILGLKPVDVPDNLVAIRRWFQIAPNQQLHLLLGRNEPVTNNDKNGGHFSLTIPKSSADKIEAFLKEKSLPYVRQKRFDGAYQIFITDPDGYVIELNEPKVE
ncbi:MAG: VOC family protein [Emticicia sp.]|nr:VOC family protein [Emticicia sp.]